MQEDLLDQADAELPAAPKHDIVELPESETVELMMRRLEKLGIPPSLMVHQEFEIDPNNPFEEYHPFHVSDGDKKGMSADSLPQVLGAGARDRLKGDMVQRYKRSRRNERRTAL
jgi:hypothetical protein